MIEWHRLIGLVIQDTCSGLPCTVEIEKDLSRKRQLLDVVILRQEGALLDRKLPDGLQDLLSHNLITYKSLHQPMDGWALKELLGHYVNYRKQVSPSFNQLLPEAQFRLYGVSTRYPEKLFSRMPALECGAGIYEIQWALDTVRVIVLSEIPMKPHNAPWLVFSGVQERVEYGLRHYQCHFKEISSVLNELIERYRQEGLTMAYTMEDFKKEYVMEHLKEVPVDEVLKQYSSEERLAGLSSEEIERFLEKMRKADQQPKQ